MFSFFKYYKKFEFNLSNLIFNLDIIDLIIKKKNKIEKISKLDRNNIYNE